MKQDPKVLEYRWIVPKYDLGFYIEQKDVGIDFCCSRITLDSSGVVLSDIDFPDISKTLISINFIELTTILEKSKELVFPIKNYEL